MTPLNIALICVFLQVGLTLFAMIRMGQARVAAVRAKEVKVKDIAIDTHDYPLNVRKLQNNVRNQFETPILFYTVVGFAAALDVANWGLAMCAVGYMLTRFVHHFVHTGSNNIGHRYQIFLLGFWLLAACWISLGIGLILR